MRLRDVYGKQSGIKQNTKIATVGLPMRTVQKKENQRPPLGSKFLKKAGKKLKAKVGRVPGDMQERYQAPIPPTKMGRPVK